MPRAVIITTHEVDYQAVTTHLGNLEEEVHPQGTIYNLGQFDVKGSAPWEVAICEVSEKNADVAAETERAISHFKPDVIFLIGAATGIKDVTAGDIVIATKVYGYEAGKVENKFLTRPEVKNSSYNLQQRAKSERKKDDWMKRVSTDPLSSYPSIFLESIASGDKEITDDRSPLLDFLQSNYNDAVAIDRVGHGFLNAVHTNQNISALTIHGIAYCIGRPETNSRESRSIALQNASAFAFEVLAKFTIATITERQNGIIIRNITPESLYTNIQEAVNINPQNLVDERHRRIDEGRTLLNSGQFDRALEYLEGLQSEIWHSSDNSHKYRIITNLGGAKLGLGKVLDGASKLIEALQYSPDDEMALARAAQGYFLQNDFASAEIYIQRALEKNSANQLARSLQVYIASPEESIESILESIPSAYHQAMDVLIALGKASLNRGLRDRAVEYWQAALDIDNSSSLNAVKVFLGVTLLEPITEQYSAIVMGQILDSQKSSLECAIRLFDEVLEGNYLNPKELLGIKFEALVNRAGSLRLLGRFDEAIRDFDIILVKDPNNYQWIKQLAMLAYEQGKKEETLNYLIPFLSNRQTPEASLLAADSLIALDRLDEAVDILDRFLQNLQSDSPKDLQREARRLKFEIFLKRNERQHAEIILNQAIDEDSENFHAIVIQLQWYKYIGEEDKISPLIDRAKAAINPNTPIIDKALIAHTLYSLGYYRDVVEVYEQFVDSTLNTELSRRLLLAYYRSENHGKALDLCKKLLERYEPQLPTSEIAAYIYREIIGDLDSARQICNVYLAKFPEDWKMRLVLAIINYETCEYEQLDSFLDSCPSIQNIICLEKHTGSYRQLALLYKVRGRINSFLEIIYEIRHHFYDDEKVHPYYQLSYMEATKSKAPESFEIVKDGCGIAIEYKPGEEQWYIIENRSDAVFAQNELNSEQPLYIKTIGKKIGDEVLIAEDNFGKNYFKIVAITDKYFAAAKLSHPLLETQTNVEDFRMLTIPMEGDQISEKWIQNFITLSQERQDYFSDIKSLYTSGRVPLGTVAKLIHRNIIETWGYLSSGSTPCIHAWSNFEHEKFEDAVITLKKGGLVVIDPISLFTIHSLGIADDVVSNIGKLGIAQSTLNLLQGLIEQTQGWEAQGFSTFGAEDGYGVMQEVPPEAVNAQRSKLEQILNWVRDNCLILPCDKALEISQDKRTELNELFGLPLVDTMLIACESGRILYSDDQWLRLYARVEFGVQGVWTQVVLHYCLIEKSVNETLYRRATLGLAQRGYSYTMIDAKTLLEAVKLSDRQVRPIYTAALIAIANSNTTFESALSVTVDFLYQLYLEINIEIIDPRDAIVHELLKTMPKSYGVRVFTQNLKPLILDKFRLIPFQAKKVIEAIDSWLILTVY
jgi:tetratricopeptide (TPR) repeat protein/nucleoside phosphorylase